MLPHLEADQLDGFLTHVKAIGANERYSSSEKIDERTRKALAPIVEKQMEKLPDGIHKHALRLLWIEIADLDDDKLLAFLKDDDLEIRRMAFAVMIRARTKGPADLVKQYIADPSPEMRRLAIAAAIPKAWRDGINDPTAQNLVAGHKTDAYMRYTNLDMSKAPKLIELPVETLEKLLKDDDEGVRVLTAYAMALEGGDQGIPILVRHLKSAKNSDEAAQTLTRALIMAWNDDMTPILAEAAKVMQSTQRTWSLRMMWPYIKNLEGPEVKKLRAKLLKEIVELRE